MTALTLFSVATRTSARQQPLCRDSLSERVTKAQREKTVLTNSVVKTTAENRFSRFSRHAVLELGRLQASAGCPPPKSPHSSFFSCDRGASSGCACGEGCGCGSVSLAEFSTFVRNTCPWKDCTCPEKVTSVCLHLCQLLTCLVPLQPCVCGETCGCGTVKISKEEMIKGKLLNPCPIRVLYGRL